MTLKPPPLRPSPLALADFAMRLVFFATAPFAVVVVAALFPVRGALFDVGAALLVFAFGEAARRFARRSRVASLVLGQAFEFEDYYRERPPRPFAYYVFYPFLFPYWLSVREARREFLVFRSYTVASFALLVGLLGWQFFSDWRPELGVLDYLPFVLLALVVETLLVLSLLMPIATTVVVYHSSSRRGRLAALLAVGLVSTGAAIGVVSQRRDPVVSFAARERVRLRTARVPVVAHRVLGRAAMAGLMASRGGFSVDAYGVVTGPPLAAARQVLTTFYKPDEAHAFNLWVSQRHAPPFIVLFFQAEPHKRPIWLGLRRDGSEIRKLSELPPGASQAMRRAEGDDADLWNWPQEVVGNDLFSASPAPD